LEKGFTEGCREIQFILALKLFLAAALLFTLLG